MTRVLYAQDRRTQQTWRYLTLHDDGTLTSEDRQMAEVIPRLCATRGWSGEQVFEDCAAQSNAYVRYFEEPEPPETREAPEDPRTTGGGPDATAPSPAGPGGAVAFPGARPRPRAR